MHRVYPFWDNWSYRLISIRWVNQSFWFWLYNLYSSSMPWCFQPPTERVSMVVHKVQVVSRHNHEGVCWKFTHQPLLDPILYPVPNVPTVCLDAGTCTKPVQYHMQVTRTSASLNSVRDECVQREWTLLINGKEHDTGNENSPNFPVCVGLLAFTVCVSVHIASHTSLSILLMKLSVSKSSILCGLEKSCSISLLAWLCNLVLSSKHISLVVVLSMLVSLFFCSCHSDVLRARNISPPYRCRMVPCFKLEHL